MKYFKGLPERPAKRGKFFDLPAKPVKQGKYFDLPEQPKPTGKFFDVPGLAVPDHPPVAPRHGAHVAEMASRPLIVSGQFCEILNPDEPVVFE